MLNGYTRTCGVMGNPVEHTMSPLIHNYLAEKMGENLVYVPFHVPMGMAGDAVKGAFALNLLGCNVTIPFKSDVIPYLKEIDPLAKRIGAVNTLVRLEDGFKGYNTDMPGLLRSFAHDEVKIEGEEVLILGAGGVARAVAVLLADSGASKIIILNRTVEKAYAIAQEVNGYAGKEICQVLPLEEYGSLRRMDEQGGWKKYLAIQATNVGMYPKEGTAVIEDAAFYEMIHTGYDLIYRPPVTRFMELTAAHGGRAFNGARMLLYQGVIAYELWTGRDVPDALADEVYDKMLEAMAGNE